MNNGHTFHFHQPPQVTNGNTAHLGVASNKNETPYQQDPSRLYEELTSLITERERARIDLIEHALTDRASRINLVSDVLPEAIARRGPKDERLNKAILPPVTEAISTLFRKKPQLFIDALFPIIGSTIRRSISASIGQMLQNISQGLEHAFTLRGLRWRLEALRTGRSFAEVVLSHTIVYRVEQIFLIHRQTGVLLQHVALNEAEAQDPQIVSSMLSAIKDFVQDSFRIGSEETLERFRVGDLTVFIEQGPQAFIAAAVRGEPPANVSEILQTALERVHVELRDLLADFSGDTSPFVAARPILEDCLIQKDRTKKRGLGLLFWVFTLGFLGAIGYGGWLLGKRINENLTLQSELNQQLNKEPGFQLVQVSINPITGEASLIISRDALARQIEEILKERGLDPQRFHLIERLVISMDPEMIKGRVFDKLSPIPEGVQLEVRGDILHLSGRARNDFIQRIERGWPAVVGLRGIDISQLENLDKEALQEQQRTRAQLAEELQHRIKLIQSINIFFDLNQPLPRQDEEPKISIIANEFKQCLVLARRLDREIMLVIVGHTDPTGQLVENDILANTRANRILSMLLNSGLDMQNLDTRGVGPAVAAQPPPGMDPNQFRRRVSFRVQQTDLIGTTSEIFSNNP